MFVILQRRKEGSKVGREGGRTDHCSGNVKEMPEDVTKSLEQTKMHFVKS